MPKSRLTDYAAAAQFHNEADAIENLIGSALRTSRNVTRRRSGDIISCWAVIGLLQAEEHFGRIRGYRHLALLKRALRGDASKLDTSEEAT